MQTEFELKSSYTLRLLSPEYDWELFRDHLILAYGRNNYTGFLDFQPDTADSWKKQMGQYTQFGLFNAQEMVGSTSMFVNGSMAVFTGSFISEEHRGKGLADYFYEARLSHLRQINYEGKIVTEILESNDRSLDAARRNSFEVIGERYQSNLGYHERYVVLSRRL